MISSDNLCMSCMHEIGNEKKCPHCGYYVDSVQMPPYLPVRTVLGNRYLVGKMLEYNGEGATYIGWDLQEKKAVNIREFIPDSFTSRTSANLNLQVMLGSEASFAELRRSFEEMWTRLVRLNGLSALINVTAVFEDLGTSYAVYDHFDGISLRDFLLRSKTGYISWEKARQLLMPTLSTLGTLHSNGIIHKGISPTTLVIGEDGKIKITGFSIGDVRTVNSRLTPQIYDGYAAIEQYGHNSAQGAWTDIYAFAAVLYRTLIGSDPIPSKERMANDRLMVPGKFAEALPAYVINGLINALQILPQDRTRSVEQLRAELSASPAATAAGVPYVRQQEQPAPVQPASQPEKKKSPALTMLITALVIILVGLGTFAVLAATVFKDKFDFGRLIPGKQTEVVSEAEKIPVPNFIERSIYDIETNAVFTGNFKLKKEEVYNSEISAGYIISQSIDPDTQVAKGTEIILYVSKGSEMILLPNVEGTNCDEAEARLTELGFKVNLSITHDEGYKENEVIMMAPTPERSYKRDTTVTLRVYQPVTEASTEDTGEVGISSTTEFQTGTTYTYTTEQQITQ